MNRYDTVIFDLDGTLLDTIGDLTESVNFVMQNHRFPIRTEKDVKMALGNGVSYLIKHMIPNGNKNLLFHTCVDEFRAYYAEHMNVHTVPFPGIMELLEKMKEEGFKMAIVSNKFDAAVKGLRDVYFGELIPVAIGESETNAKKPAPDMILSAINELNSSPERTVYIGDSEVDIETAQNAGVPCISITWGFRDWEFLNRNDALQFAYEPEELLKLINEEEKELKIKQKNQTFERKEGWEK